MKHGRRHDSLKEKAYRDRAASNAEGYKRPYRPIDVAKGNPDAPKPPPAEVPLGAALPKKAKRQLRRMGIDPEKDEKEG